MQPLDYIVFLIAAAVPLLAALLHFRLPTLPAYFAVGMLAGPHAFGVLDESAEARFAGDIGVLLLMFTIGLNFSFSELRAMRRHVFLFGGLQVAMTAAAVATLTVLAGGSWGLGLAIGGAAAMSSTAIISQILLEENIATTAHGRRALGALLFQDILVIPLIAFYSIGGMGEAAMAETGIVGVKIILAIAAVGVLGPWILPRWMNFIARTGKDELFVLNVMGVIALASWGAHLAGISHALGAFLAGILIADTLHRFRVERVIEPFRQLFLGFFFATIGAQVDPGAWAKNWHWVFLAAAGFIAVKTPACFFAARIAGAHRATSLRAGILLGGGGEFGFVLLSVGLGSGLIAPEVFQLLAPANLLAMLATPLVWPHSESLIHKLCPADWLASARRMTENLSKTQGLKNHVVICGYGRTGRAAAAVLKEVGADFVVMEDDYLTLRAHEGEARLIYGDSSREDSLMSARVGEAAALIVSFPSQVAAHMTVRRARMLNPRLVVIAKATHVAEAKVLAQAGATRVMVGAQESGFSMARLATAGLSVKGEGEEEGEGESLAPEIVRAAIQSARARENPHYHPHSHSQTDSHSQRDKDNGKETG